ncbi:MAG: hypothetical protein JXR31_15295, partial [Prolixibacteraceae bacterium]|nr:hypothetical protein [Prolixibacteraceae bacterium]
PLVFDDKMIFTPGGSKTTIVALNRLTGETIWQTESIQDTSYFTSPVLFNKNGKEVLFTSTLHHDIFVDCKTGEIIQKFDHISGMVPQVIDDRIYFTGQYKTTGTLSSYSENLKERTIVWKDTAITYMIGGAVNYHGKIIVAGFDRGIFCLDQETGKVLSYYNDMNSSTFIVADDLIYCLEDGRGRLSLFRLNENNLELVSSFRIRMGTGPMIAHLSISDGLLFVRRGEVLMAYNIRNDKGKEV